MGDMFRGEQMALAQLFIQPEAAYLTVSELGEAGIIQFRDLNDDVNAFQRKFVTEVKRCDELERKLRYIEAEIKKERYIILRDAAEMPRAPNPREVIDLEAHLEKTEGDIKELTENAITLRTNYLELSQYQQVLQKTNDFLSGNMQDPADYTFHLGDDAARGGQLQFVAGVVDRERMPAFERMLWRVSRGNIFLRQADIEEPLEDPITGNLLDKNVFAAFFQGEVLHQRVKKVCEGFRANLYSCPDSPPERAKILNQLKTRLEDLNTVMNQTEDHRRRVLIGVAKDIQNWIIMTKKMKAIYHTLNCCNVDVSKKCLIAEGWVPVNDIEQLREILNNSSEASGSSIPSFMNIIRNSEEPPTFHRTNKFTQGFQNLIDAYGMATYGEINPALYSIVTFPFLFAIMFGDMGHGIILLLFGLFLVKIEKTFKKGESEIMDIFFSGRYVIVMMGTFSIYTGFIYNDLFSKSMNIFGSSWSITYQNFSIVSGHESLQLDPKTDYSQIPYPLGLDPVWALSANKIIFLNSFKMKLSIIFGVFHMMFGVALGVINFVHFKTYSSILLEFLPQMIFLAALFLWLVVMMFMKWIIYGPSPNADIVHSPFCAPSVLLYFINMMLFSETTTHEECEPYMFPMQPFLQKLLVFIALICIPWMLLGKPIFIVMKRRRAKVTSQGDVIRSMMQLEEEPLGELFIHQAIHTIEYVLSTVSHTASYLRLWALSLAHAQLSEVLWNMVLQRGLQMDSYLGVVTLFIFFAVWAGLTVAILVMMEGLSAFLHTLRLHWVEFMSKFYSGLGYIFQPFSFKTIFEKKDDES